MASDNRVRLIAEIDATSKGLLDALKQASGAVDNTSNNWKQQFSTLKDSTNLVSQSVKNLSELVGKVGDVDMDVSGIENVKDAISSVSQSFESVKGDIDSFVDKLVSMRQVASEMGMPVEEYQRFSEAVRQAGSNMDDAGRMMQSMRQKIQDFANGVPEAQDAFGKLGITLEQLSSHSVTENFDSIIQSMKSIASPTEQAQASMDMFKTSMERAVKVSQEYNKLLTTQANNTFASDKDVQNAISLSSAIGKLGEQLSHLTTEKAKDADATRSMDSEEAVNLATVEKAIEAQRRYNDSLDAVIAKLSGVHSAYRKMQESLGNTEVFDISSIASGATTGFSESINTVLSLLDEERDKIRQLASVQESLGAPIDTSYLEDYKNHLSETYGMLSRMATAMLGEATHLDLSGDVEQANRLRDAINNVLEPRRQDVLNQLDEVKAKLNDFTQKNTELQVKVNTENAKKNLKDLYAMMADLLKPIATKAKVNVDASDIEKAHASLSRFRSDLKSSDFVLDGSALSNVSKGAVELLERIGACRIEMNDMMSTLSSIEPDKVHEVGSAFDSVTSTLAGLSSGTATTMTGLNVAVDLTKDAITGMLDKLREMGTFHAIDIDTSKLENAVSLVERLRDRAIQTKVSVEASEIEKAKALLDSLKDKVVKGKVEFDMSALDKVRAEIAKAEEAMLSMNKDITPEGFKELDKATGDLIGKLQECHAGMESVVSGINGIDASTVAGLTADFENVARTIASISDEENRVATTTEELGNVATDVAGRISLIAENLKGISATKKVDIDISQLEECIRMVEQLKSTAIKPTVDASALGEMKEQLKKIADEVARVNYEAEKNRLEKIWDGAKAGASAVSNAISKIGSAFAHPVKSAGQLGDALTRGVMRATEVGERAILGLANAIRHPIEAVKDMKRAMDDFVASTHRGKDGVSGIGNAAGSTAGTLKQVAGQLLGMGSVVAVLVKGFQSMGQIIKSYVLDPWQKATEEARKFQEWLSKGQTRTADKNFSRAEAMENDLRKYVELQRKYRESGSHQDRFAVDQQKKVLGTYGIEWKYDADADKVIKEQLEYASNKKIEALKSKIEALEKSNTALDEEYKDRDSYLKNDLGRNPDEKHRNKQRLVEIAEQKGENLGTIQEIRAQIRALQKEDKYADWTAEGRAIGNDARAKREREMEKSAKENMEKEKKAFDEASKKLEEWASDLSDNDRQKKLRAILEKYQELVKAGIPEEKARQTAVKAVKKVLEEEASSEKQENERLVKTLEDRMNAYKEAYKSELEAAREIKRVNDERIKSERELAEERRREIIDDRRERLDRKKSQFGFTLPDDFSFNESSSKRRKRRRNARLDERIDEKMKKREEGRKVHFTPREKKRINERRKLDRQDRQLQASLKQMTAADKQLKAAEMQERLAQELLKAQTGRDDARDRRRKRGRDLKDAKAPKDSLNLTAEDLFDTAKTKGLYAEGVGAPAGKVRRSTYDRMFLQLHRDLQDIKKNVHFVK